MDKESNIIAKSLVHTRRLRGVSEIFKKMENAKSGKTFRALSDSLPRQQRKLKIVEDNIKNAPKKAIKGFFDRSGKTLRKAFIRV